MSKVQMLRVFVNQRLTAAAEEIFGLFERTIAEYEEQLEFSTKEIHRQRKLLDSVFNPEVRLHRAEVQKLVVVEDIYEQQDCASLDQEDPEPLQIKEEQGELWSCQEGEQLQGLEEADTKFTSPVPVKSEEDEETPQPSQLHQRQTEQMGTEVDGEDCGGPEPARNTEPDRHLEPATHETSPHSSESETDCSGDWEEPKSGLNPLQNSEVPVSDMECNIAKTLIGHKGNLQKYAGIQTREQHFTCSVCKANFLFSNSLVKHMKIHNGEKPFSCSVCNKRFTEHSDLSQHLPVHTEEKPFSCSFCSKRFAHHSNLRQHLTVHTGEKPYSCSVCSKRFAQHCNLRQHLTVHTGEKPFSCSVCSKSFAHHSNLRQHLTVHTGEKPFSCSVCSKRFANHRNLRRHLTVHTGEKPFSCSVCGKQFTRSENVKQHKCVGERAGIDKAAEMLVEPLFFQQD